MTLAALGLMLLVIALTRHSFLGDGIRQLPDAITQDRPPIGQARWLFFPTLLWTMVHPFVMAGWISSVEQAVWPFLASSLLAGLLYLVALREWLRADGHRAAARTAALLLAGSTVPFVWLYSDIAEPQLAAAIVVATLAIIRSRCQRGVCTSTTAMTAIVVIALASLIYQGLILALAFVPLVVPWQILGRRAILIGAAAVLIVTASIAVGTRVLVGDTVEEAVASVTTSTPNPLLRASFSIPTGPKWLAALIAGPPQAFVALDGFGGLRALGNTLRTPGRMRSALVNIVRLMIGFVLVLVMMIAIVRRRDWRLLLAIAAVVALPVIRNNQYGYVKFFILWPVIVALASTAFSPRYIAAAAGLLLTLNGSLVAREVYEGRMRYEQVSAQYKDVTPDTCFFTSDWSAPFPYLWPGTTVGIIEKLAAGRDPDEQSRLLTSSLGRCFCDASSVWTDTTTASAPVIESLMTTFRYAALDLREILLSPSQGVVIGRAPIPLYVYSPDHQGDECRLIRRTEAQ